MQKKNLKATFGFSLLNSAPTYCYSGIRRKTVVNMPPLPSLDLKETETVSPTKALLPHQYCVRGLFFKEPLLNPAQKVPRVSELSPTATGLGQAASSIMPGCLHPVPAQERRVSWLNRDPSLGLQLDLSSSIKEVFLRPTTQSDLFQLSTPCATAGNMLKFPFPVLFSMTPSPPQRSPSGQTSSSPTTMR